MYAKRESRTLGNVGETLIEWALLQLRKAGSTEKLLWRPVHARGAQIDSPGAGRAVKRTGEGEFGKIERGASATFCLEDMMRLCTVSEVPA
jgi:hypothetical protein